MTGRGFGAPCKMIPYKMVICKRKSTNIALNYWRIRYLLRLQHCNDAFEMTPREQTAYHPHEKKIHHNILSKIVIISF